MSGPEVLLALVESEVVLWVDGGRLHYRAPAGALDDDLRARVGACRGAIVALVSAVAVLPQSRDAWSADDAFEFDERAGICEFEGELARTEAGRVAERCVRLAHTQRFLKRAALHRSLSGDRR